MEQTGATARPKNPDGTVNWTVVFDDAERGILQAIDKTTGVEQLNGLIAQIAPLLFQRKNDAALRDEFIKKMNGILRGNEELGFDSTKSKIRRALEEEKTHRIEEAKKYIANKNTAQSLERRRSNWSGFLGEAFFGTRIRLLASIGIVFIIIIGAALTQIDLHALIPETPPASAEKATAPDSEAAPAPENPAPPAPRAKRDKDLYPVFLMKPVTFQFGTSRTSLVPVIVAPAYDKSGKICQIAPRIAESLTFKLTGKANQAYLGSPTELARIAASIKTDMDQYLGAGKIEDLYLIDTRKFDQTALRTAYRGCGMFNLPIKPDELLAQ